MIIIYLFTLSNFLVKNFIIKMTKKKFITNLLNFISKYKFLSNLFSMFLILIVIFSNLKLFKKKNSIKGLALSSQRFRNDIDILNNSSELSIYSFPMKIQLLLLIPFQEYLYRYNEKYFYPLEELINVKLTNQKYLSKILNLFFSYFKFILTPSVSYLQDFDLSRAAKKNGLKHIALQRENFGIVEKQANDILNWYDQLEKPSANLIIVHNVSTKTLFQNTQFAKNSVIKALGCVRMDNYIDRLKKDIFKKNKLKKTITFFSFATNVGCHLAEQPRIAAFEKNRGLLNFFKNTHNLVIDFAKKSPEIQVNIKTKWEKNWVDLILKNWTEFSRDLDFPENCKVSALGNPHDLMIESDLVIGFNSTTLLEAGLRDIPVIIPKFDEASTIYADHFDFIEYEDGFKIVEDPKKLHDVIYESLLNFNISKEKREIRKNLFQKYVSEMEGQSKERYIESIMKTII